MSNDEELNYKIRFENHVSATAPAQKVFIKTKLDKDLDLRTFRVGSLGFGNFTYNPKSKSSTLQVGTGIKRHELIPLEPCTLKAFSSRTFRHYLEAIKSAL